MAIAPALADRSPAAKGPNPARSPASPVGKSSTLALSRGVCSGLFVGFRLPDVLYFLVQEM